MKQIVGLIIGIGLLFQLSIANAQERDSMLVKKVVEHGLNDCKDYLISPSKWDKKDWFIAGGVTAATGALIAWGDQPVYNFSNTLHSKGLDKLSVYIEPMGDIYPAVTMSGFLLAGLISKNNYTFETGLIAAESYAFTGVFCQAVKVTAGRTRPNNYDTSNPHQWSGPFFKGNSFFSGHTSSAFSVASVIAYRYRETTWVPILSYSLATLGGLQRIYQNRHWASDVFMGAAIGTATGIFLCKQWEESSIRFYPMATSGGAGFSMVIPIK